MLSIACDELDELWVSVAVAARDRICCLHQQNQLSTQPGINRALLCCLVAPQVGVGKLSFAQQRSHFALWALVKAPLLIGANLEKISNSSLSILKAKEVRSM